MKTSVVLSAYNGEKYIFEQMESIRTQSVPVDEVLILDDCSSDATPQICSDFIEKNNLETWSVIRNETNIGYIQNFKKGFNKAKGDIIFIADQDDIWCKNKVERIIFMFDKYADALSITTAYSRFNDETILSLHTHIPNRKKNGIKKISFFEFCQFHWYLGMATAFRKELIRLHYAECCKAITYDIAINFIAVMHNGLYFLDEILVKRRSYPLSTSNRMKKNAADNLFGGNIVKYHIFDKGQNLMGFKSYIDQYMDNKDLLLESLRQIEFNELRQKAQSESSFICWLKLIKHLNYYMSFRNFIKDGIWIFNEKYKYWLK